MFCAIQRYFLWRRSYEKTQQERSCLFGQLKWMTVIRAVYCFTCPSFIFLNDTIYLRAWVELKLVQHGTMRGI